MNRYGESLLKFWVGLCWAIAIAKYYPSDRSHSLAVLAYIPSLLNLSFALALSILLKRSRLWKMTALCCAFFSFATFCFENPRLLYIRLRPVETNPSIRIFQWNVWGSRCGVSRIADVISSQKPDVICLNEPKYSRKAKDFPDYRKYLAGKWNQSGQRNVLLLSRYSIQQIRSLHIWGSDGIYVSLKTNPPLSFFVLDIAANTEVFRRKVFELFANNLQENRDFPEIILGDLNTPVQSFSVQSTMGKLYQDSYEIAGSGCGYTWPAWAPVMRIDSIFVKEPDRVLRHRSGASLLSDHLWQWIDYAID